jgi:extradiol dioxygenase family protein
MSAPTPFHLAFAVTDIDATREFYVNKLGCKMGRSAERWIDFDFFGHQISAHLVDGALSPAETNPVDGEKVPSRHFGAILEWHDWHAMKDRLVAENTEFIIEPPPALPAKLASKPQCFFVIRQATHSNSRHFVTAR